MGQQVEIPHLLAEEIRIFQTIQHSVWPVKMVVRWKRGAIRDGQKKISILDSEAVGIEIADVGSVVLVDIAVAQQVFQ